MAACGAAVPQTAGRGLGHTGGTLDKMETIPGWRSTLTPDEVARILDDVGAVINAAGPDLAPADRKLYALRDITGTVESIPLIASSIMSKKIAEGTGALVLDVKVGTGAFMKDVGRARELAEMMVGLGAAHGVRTTALLTQMDVPLGRTAGNALEVVESVEVLAGGGPPDVVELTLAWPARCSSWSGSTTPTRPPRWPTGGPWTCGGAMVRAQGGDPTRPAPPRRRDRGRRRAGHRHARPARRHGRRRGGLAPRRRPRPARRTTSPPPPASCGARRSATTSRRASPSSSSTSTTPPASTSALAALDGRHRDHPDPVDPPADLASSVDVALTTSAGQRFSTSIGLDALVRRGGRSRGPGRRS